MKLFPGHWVLIGLCAAGFALGGCSDNFFDPSAFGVFQDEDVNLPAKNYAAGDVLAHQAGTFIGMHDLVHASVLLDADEPRTRAKIGRLISEQIGLRLSQLGYRVDLSEVVEADASPNYLKPAMRAGEKADFIIAGTYLRRRTDLAVSARIVDARSQRVVAVFDYTLPQSRDVARMAEPETRIFKVSE